MKACRPNAGFSLVEVMVAILILGVALASLAHGITTALRASKDSELQTTAALLAAGQIELLRADGILVDGVTEGQGGDGLALYKWKQTVTSTAIDGLHEVALEVLHSSETKPVYELHTLLFDPPADSLTNRPVANQRKPTRGRPSRRNTP